MTTWFQCKWDRITFKDIIRSFVKVGVLHTGDYPEGVQHDHCLKDLVPKYDIDIFEVFCSMLYCFTIIA